MKKSPFEENRSLETAINIFNQRIIDAKTIYQKHAGNFVERSCPVCSSGNKQELPAFHDTYSICKCRVCGSEYVNPAPDPAAIDDYYQNGECNKMLAELTRSRTKKFNIDDRVKAICELVEKNGKKELKILEVGCSSGLFLQGLRDHLCEKFPNLDSPKMHGIDLDRDAIEKKVDPDLNLQCCSAEELNGSGTEAGTYDLVLHYELIEHLVNPYQFMATVKGLLKPGGHTVFTTPNAQGAENLASGYNTRRLIAHAIFPPMHLNAFSIQNVPLFSYRLGFEIVEISTPGKLDIDMIGKNKGFLTNDSFMPITEVDDALKESLQRYTVACKSSSHMQCILRKPL